MSRLYKLLNLTVFAAILYAVGISISRNGFKLPSLPRPKKASARAAGQRGTLSRYSGSYGRSRGSRSSAGGIQQQQNRMERYRGVFMQ